MDDTTHENGLDRRKLIKRAGVVTAGVAAWSTPMVSSLAASAHAAGSQPTKCTTCGGFPTCGQSANSSDGICYCFNFQDDPNECVCAVNAFCSGLATCTQQADCPAGFACISAANGCGQPVCLPNCDSPSLRRIALSSSGPTAVPS